MAYERVKCIFEAFFFVTDTRLFRTAKHRDELQHYQFSYHARHDAGVA